MKSRRIELDDLKADTVIELTENDVAHITGGGYFTEIGGLGSEHEVLRRQHDKWAYIESFGL